MLELGAVKLQQGEFLLSADFNVENGDKVAVLGPSGAGKSTLLAAIAGFFTPDSGRILSEGQDLTALPPAQRPVSILFQDNNLFPHLSVNDNIGLGLDPSLRLTKDQWQEVETALDRVGLTGLGKRKPATLSGGQIARVALARALIRARPLMLLDEPFGALGPGLRAEMLELVRELADETGATLLMVSHDPDDARAIADKVIWVDGGHAYPPRDMAEIFKDPPAAMATYLGK